MLIDEVKIRVYGGAGGRGAVAFNKAKLAVGPVGGSGGRGGNITFEGVSNISALIQFQNKKEVRAGNGQNGRSQFRDGESGKDLILQVPVGTVLTNTETGAMTEITKVGEQWLAVKGGKGGKGNFKYRSPVNTSPMEFQEGLPGEGAVLQLELKMIADIGLVGLPNAGKSSLLNELTAAKSKVANYPFTTLEPHLGAYYGLIIADIPGLIEGASGGKGLGTKFLRHVERTKIIFHLISAEEADPVTAYRTIRTELATYNEALAEKQEYVFLTKTDLVTPEVLKEKLVALKKLKLKPIPFSILDTESLVAVKKILEKIQAEK